MNYSVRKNVFGIDNAQQIGEWIESLKDKTTEGILRASQNNSSPLHKYIDWDDKSAAHAHRLVTVRSLVAAITIEIPTGPIKAFESVVIDEIKQYAGIEKISQDQTLVEQVVESAIKELSYWKIKHERLSEFFGAIFHEITKAEETYRRKNEKTKGASQRGKHQASNSSNKKADGKHNNRRRIPSAS